MKTRKRITIHGIVQGVGFRPYIHKKVKHYKLKGWICNTEQGVEMEVEGEQDAICIFLKNIKNDIPPLAIIEKIITDDLSLIGYTDFKIKKSKSNHLNPMALIPPDISICEDCYNELINPSDRRYNYPFINCTNCGPRFTIINELPYDREKTTMKSFSMCSDCQSEYNNIDNRRYHAQPNA
ncbi:MAG: acylphosphatase, partial [Atribacterota bacterium]|nr:acylphosphatase [Atribacterota bacterium]